MKRFSLKNFTPFTALLFFLCLLFSIQGAAANNEESLIILPFQVDESIPKEYIPLKDGLPSMLASRLAQRAKVHPLVQTNITRQLSDLLSQGQQQNFLALLQEHQAKYLLMGSISQKNAETVLFCHVFTQAGQPFTFEQTINGEQNALAAIDALAWNISGEIFGFPKPSAEQVQKEAQSGTVAFQTTHPERAYRENVLPLNDPGLNEESSFTLLTSRKSRVIPLTMRDINTADIDGDGRQELLLLADTNFFIYRFSEDRFQQLASLPLARHRRMHAVTTADMNENGRPEIYISGNNGDLPSSDILEWDGQSLQQLGTSIPWYLQAINSKNLNERPVLLGQKNSFSAPLAKTIYTMHLTKPDHADHVVPVEEYPLPQGVNLFSFAYADVDGNGQKELVTLNGQNRLQVYDKEGAQVWTSTVQYGASLNFFGTLSSNDKANRQPIYTKSRIVVQDLDSDGKDEIIIGRNRIEKVPYFPNMIYTDGSSIAILQWQDSKLTPLWETQKTPAYIVGTQVVLTENTGEIPQIQLFFAESSEGNLLDFFAGNKTTVKVLIIAPKTLN